MIVVKLKTIADFQDAHALITEMGQWDVEQCDKNGLPSLDVLPTYYSADAQTLRDKSTAPGAAMYVAREGAVSTGCIGYSGHNGTADIVKFYVRPDGRGKGTGTQLLSTALDAIEQAGFRTVRLVTISFMVDAISLYRKFGFEDCDPFEAAPLGLEAATRFMAMDLANLQAMRSSSRHRSGP